MTQLNIVELAKQGDVGAIASLMNRHLQPKGIAAKVAFKDAYLEVILESTEVPNQQTLVAFVCKGLTKLGAMSVQKVKIYGQQNGKNFYAWIKDFDLGITEPDTDLEDNQQFSNNSQILTLSINLSGNIARELKTEDFENIANKIINDILYSCDDILIEKISISNENCVISKER